MENVVRCPVTEMAKKLEIMLCLFVAEHNISFSVVDHLSCLIKSGIPDSQIVKKLVLNRHKTQKIVTSVTGPENSRNISQFCNKFYYSIAIDESTDCTVSTNLAIIVRIFDGKCRDRFLSLEPLVDSTADTICGKIVEVLNTNNIPLKNMVGFAADNCNVMMGVVRGVQAKLKLLVPNLFVNGCVCHILNLVSSSAYSCLPKTIEKFITDVNYYFCNSSNRKKEFIKFQEYFGTANHVIFKYASTRWLSRQEVVDRFLEQWEPLKYYFSLIDFENSEKKEKVKNISCCLLDPEMKIYFLFLSYFLKIVNNINLEMQSEDARIHILHSRLQFLFMQVARNFMKKESLEFGDVTQINLNENNLPINEIFCGTEVDILCETNNIDTNLIFKFKQTVQQLYKKFCEELRKKVDFSNKMLIMFNNFSPSNVISGKANSIIPLLVKLFPHEDQAYERINCQFRALADLPELKHLKNETVCKFWNEVSMIKNELGELMFPDISRIASGVLSIPHSSANVERIFSIQNLIKTKTRNRLNVETVSNLIKTNDLLRSSETNCYNYTISNDLIK